MRYQRNIGKRPKDWYRNILVLWQEDDATKMDPDSEKVGSAFERITGRRFVKPTDPGSEKIYDDVVEYATPNGWVVGHSCEGSYIGVIVKDTTRVWKPMSSAPKNGSRILAKCKSYSISEPFVIEAQWNAEKGYWSFGRDGSQPVVPISWMEIPNDE